MSERIKRSAPWLVIPAWALAAFITSWFASGTRAEVRPNLGAVSVAPSDLACTDCVTLTTETAGNYVTSIAGGTGITDLSAASEGATPTISTDSTEAGFLASGALTCGASTAGKAKVHTTPLQYCDNSATPTLRYSAYGDSTGKATAVAANSVALGGDTTGNYALGDAEGGAATTGDSATAFFSAGQIEAARGGTGLDSSASTGVAYNTSGTWSFQRWQGSGSLVCPGGVESAGVCKTFTNLSNSSTPTSAGNAQGVPMDLDVVTQMRAWGRLSVAPASGSKITIECDTDTALGSPTVCASVTTTTATGWYVGTWTALAGADCIAAGVVCRAGMSNGDGTADPVLLMAGLSVR